MRKVQSVCLFTGHCVCPAIFSVFFFFFSFSVRTMSPNCEAVNFIVIAAFSVHVLVPHADPCGLPQVGKRSWAERSTGVPASRR